MPTPLDALQHLCAALHPLAPDDWADFSRLWHPFSVARKEVVTGAGETEKYLYFVVEGVQRVYALDDADREATLVFSYPPSFAGVVDSLLLQRPSRYYFETLTPSVFLRASFRDLQAAMDRRSAINSLIRIGISHALSGVLERLVELQCYTAEEKLRALLRRSPHILQRVPHKYLANYLGVDPTNFSKLINRIRL